MYRFRNWIVVLIVGLLVAGLAFVPLAMTAVAAGLSADTVIADDPGLPTPVPRPGGGDGTCGFAWGG
jgi:hypothetical protein